VAVGVVAAVAPTAPRHRLVIEQNEALPVVANRESIEEVLGSLVENAIKHSPGGGEVEVRLIRQNDRAVVSVRDHGVGIDRERQAHVFEPFYEAVPPGKQGYRGIIGLSLYLSKLAVERNGGSIWLSSEPGQGTTFSVSLPLA
jgi:signal transduction histidine kinase